MKFFELIPSGTNIDFIGKFRLFLVFSILCAIATAVGIYTKGFNYGIDFTGGTVMNVKFTDALSIDHVRKLVADAGEPEASVVALGKDNREYLITSRTPVEKNKLGDLSRKLVEKAGGSERLKIVSTDVVGPKVGAELKSAALRSLFYTVLLITVYIWFRFDFKFAPGATIAMVHDLTMAAGFYLVTGREFTITAIAALLTIAGYSVNDTIVVYDRVREMYKKGGPGLPLPETINSAINITLSRTILTSGLTLLSVLPIVFFCGGEIRDFAIAMVFGIFVGTYSTMYIASPMTIYIERWTRRKDQTQSSPGRHRPAPA